jgi:hypothetical protein
MEKSFLNFKVTSNFHFPIHDFSTQLYRQRIRTGIRQILQVPSISAGWRNLMQLIRMSLVAEGILPVQMERYTSRANPRLNALSQTRLRYTIMRYDKASMQPYHEGGFQEGEVFWACRRWPQDLQAPRYSAVCPLPRQLFLETLRAVWFLLIRAVLLERSQVYRLRIWNQMAVWAVAWENHMLMEQSAREYSMVRRKMRRDFGMVVF